MFRFSINVHRPVSPPLVFRSLTKSLKHPFNRASYPLGNKVLSPSENAIVAWRCGDIHLHLVPGLRLHGTFIPKPLFQSVMVTLQISFPFDHPYVHTYPSTIGGERETCLWLFNLASSRQHSAGIVALHSEFMAEVPLCFSSLSPDSATCWQSPPDHVHPWFVILLHLAPWQRVS
jgi:hypothetical protein